MTRWNLYLFWFTAEFKSCLISFLVTTQDAFNVAYPSSMKDACYNEPGVYNLLLSSCIGYCTKSAKRVQISHDIVQLVVAQYRARAHPVTFVVFFQVTEKGWKRSSWMINLLLDVSMWSITACFYSLFAFWLAQYSTTRKNIRRYFTPKHLRYCLPRVSQ